MSVKSSTDITSLFFYNISLSVDIIYINVVEIELIVLFKCNPLIVKYGCINASCVLSHSVDDHQRSHVWSYFSSAKSQDTACDTCEKATNRI